MNRKKLDKNQKIFYFLAFLALILIFMGETLWGLMYNKSLVSTLGLTIVSNILISLALLLFIIIINLFYFFPDIAAWSSKTPKYELKLNFIELFSFKKNRILLAFIGFSVYLLSYILLIISLISIWNLNLIFIMSLVLLVSLYTCGGIIIGSIILNRKEKQDSLFKSKDRSKINELLKNYLIWAAIAIIIGLIVYILSFIFLNYDIFQIYWIIIIVSYLKDFLDQKGIIKTSQRQFEHLPLIFSVLIISCIRFGVIWNNLLNFSTVDQIGLIFSYSFMIILSSLDFLIDVAQDFEVV